MVRDLVAGAFPGLILPVIPEHRPVFGIPCPPDMQNLKHVSDLAVICAPAHTVPNLALRLARAGTVQT